MNETNISKVYLLSVPLESDYKHTLYFNSKEAQNNYFKSKIVKEYTNFTYQRKDNLIYVPDHYDDIYNVNYVMYQNSKYNNKWFYAFVKNLKFENDECTIVEIETDVIQTWMFDYTVKPSFVEREHVKDDTPGLQTVDEGLETGEFIINKETTMIIYNQCEPVLAVTELPGGNDENKQVFRQYNGLFQGCAFIAGGEGVDAIFGEYGSVEHIIKHYVKNGKADAIQAIFMCPKSLINSNSIITSAGWNGVVSYKEIKETTNPYGYTLIAQTKPTTVDGYEPRNKKLLTYPYSFINLDNNVGTCTQYKYENFLHDSYFFSADVALVPGISTKIYPNNYLKVVNNYHHAMMGAKLPICSWASDVYTNWLTQNGVNVGLSMVSGVGQIVAGAAIGMASGGIGLAVGGSQIIGGVSTIANTMAQMHQQSFTPPSLQGNINGGDVNFGMGLANPIVYEMSIKHGKAREIDGFFDMFGYKTNLVKIPNKAHRSRYWYTKTIDVNIDGSIPQDDMQKIKDCYNNGITFWRNANEIQDYSLSNDIAIIE